MAQKDVKSIERKLVHMLNNIKKLEKVAFDAESHLIELQNENKAKNSFHENLREYFNTGRNDKRTVEKIQLEANAISYIKSLEHTLEFVMQGYREHTQHQIKNTRHNYEEMFKNFETCYTSKVIKKQNQMIAALKNMLTEYLIGGEENTNTLQQENAYLKAENRKLREICFAFNKSKTVEVNNNEMDIDI